MPIVTLVIYPPCNMVLAIFMDYLAWLAIRVHFRTMHLTHLVNYKTPSTQSQLIDGK